MGKRPQRPTSTADAPGASAGPVQAKLKNKNKNGGAPARGSSKSSARAAEGARRHRMHAKSDRDDRISDPAIRHLGYRAGIWRFQRGVYDAMRAHVNDLLGRLVQRGVAQMTYQRAKTLKPKHLQCALGLEGITAYA